MFSSSCCRRASAAFEEDAAASYANNNATRRAEAAGDDRGCCCGGAGGRSGGGAASGRSQSRAATAGWRRRSAPLLLPSLLNECSQVCVGGYRSSLVVLEPRPRLLGSLAGRRDSGGREWLQRSPAKSAEQVSRRKKRAGAPSAWTAPARPWGRAAWTTQAPPGASSAGRRLRLGSPFSHVSPISSSPLRGSGAHPTA